MNRLIAFACLIACTAVGCQSSPSTVVQAFCSAPRDWITASGQPFQADVAMCHLALSGSRTAFSPVRFDSPSATVDVAFTGGSPDGLAGLAVWDTAATDRPFTCLVVRAEGHRRVFRGSSPGAPLGGRGWQPIPDEETAGFLSLSVVVDPDGFEFSLNGRPVERYGPESASTFGDPAPPGRYRVGIVCEDAETRWKNFVARDGAAGRAAGSEALKDWGDAGAAEALLGLAVEDTRQVAASPSRMGVRRIVASLDQARRIEGGPAGAARLEGVDELASKIRERLVAACRRIGEADFAARAFARVLGAAARPAESSEAKAYADRAAKAESEGRIALASCLYAAAAAKGEASAYAEPLERLRSELAGLDLDYSIASLAPNPIFDDRFFWQIVRESYGALRLRDGGSLRIQVRVLRSANDADSSKGERRVAVYSKGKGRLPELTDERDRLEKELPDELLEAQARYNVMRTGSKLGGEVRTTDVRAVTLEGRSYRLLVDDADALLRGFQRLEALEREIAEEQKVHQVTYESVPATLHTNSLLVEFSTRVELDSRVLVELEKERVYLGIEQWSHGAVPRLGIAASSYSEATVTEAIRTVAKRVLKRFRTGIAPENLLSKLESADRLDFALRLARNAGGREGRLLLEWTLKNELSLGGRQLTAAADLLLR